MPGHGVGAAKQATTGVSRLIRPLLLPLAANLTTISTNLLNLCTISSPVNSSATSSICSDFSGLGSRLTVFSDLVQVVNGNPLSLCPSPAPVPHGTSTDKSVNHSTWIISPTISAANPKAALRAEVPEPSCHHQNGPAQQNRRQVVVSFLAPHASSRIDPAPPRVNLPSSRRLPKALAAPLSPIDLRSQDAPTILEPAPGGRLGGSRCITFPTASYARQNHQQTQPPSVNAPANPPLPAAAIHQPFNPGGSLTPAPAAANSRDVADPARRPYNPQDYYLQSPFRSQPLSASRRLRRLSGAARLWNPTNSTRALPTDSSNRRRRRPSTPPPPAVPLSHPALDAADPADTGAGNYPLLTLPEQRQTRHSGSGRPSLQVDRRGSGDHRISLPKSIRHSYDSKQVEHTPTPTGDRQPSPLQEVFPNPGPPRSTGRRKQGESLSNPCVEEASEESTPRILNKGKEKAIMGSEVDGQRNSYTRDLERGPDVLDPRRHSNLSAGDGIGSAISSSNSSIMGEDIQGDMGEEWGPQHPCFPHLNPHVPIGSNEYQTTRVIRIRRDWLLQGDLAPTFSNLYPEILDPAGLSEQEFRRIIEKLNGELVPIFSPYDWRNVLDAMLGLVTGWLWDDFGFTGVKSRLNRLEAWIEQWNKEMEKAMGSEEGATPPKLISLRRTGYMTLDIQISDPEVAPAPSTPGASQAGGPIEPLGDGPV